MRIGTLGYMAPEVQGFFGGHDIAVAYSVSVDIWSIGVITMELLLKRCPFANNSAFFLYLQGHKPLNFDGVSGVSISENCRKFVQGLLTLDPVARFTASAALGDAWLAEATPSMGHENW
jgi:serine/threonine protein kinase